MNTKKKLVVLTMVVMMLVTAVGYAAWSDSLVALGTAKTATFDVYFKEASCNGQMDPVMGLGTDDVCFTVNGIVPGETRTVYLTIKNNGTLDAKLTDLVSTRQPLGPYDAINFIMVRSSAETIPAGGTGVLEVSFTINDAYDDFDDGQPIVYSDTFRIKVTYAQP